MAAETSVCALTLITTGTNKEMRNRKGPCVPAGTIDDPEHDRESPEWQPSMMKLRPKGERTLPHPGHTEFSNCNSLHGGPTKDPCFGEKDNRAIKS